jgi:hypothetical protein
MLPLRSLRLSLFTSTTALRSESTVTKLARGSWFPGFGGRPDAALAYTRKQIDHSFVFVPLPRL